jgi:hypothetical protein
MPTPTRVLKEIRGGDAIDTEARQWGALRQLITMMSLLSNGRDVANRLTPEETRLRLAYRDALPRLNPRSSSYEYDEALNKELLDRFFSPAWRAHYQELTARQGQHQADLARREDANREQQKSLVAQWRRERLQSLALEGARSVLPIALLALFVWPVASLFLVRGRPPAQAGGPMPSPNLYRVDVFGMQYALALSSGVVLDKELWTETNVTTTTHGGDTFLIGGVMHTTPTTRSTSVQSTVYHRYWLGDAGGRQTWARFANDEFPANKGQTISTIANGTSTWMAYNHSTNQLVTFKKGWHRTHAYELGWVTRVLFLTTGVASAAVGSFGMWVAIMFLWGIEALAIKLYVGYLRNQRFEKEHLPRLRSLIASATAAASS